jgi:hypothetical protein
VQNNYIGTDITGTHDIGNGGDGVFINWSNQNHIGTAGAGNVISGNADNAPAGNGVRIQLGSQNLVQGNSIGVDVTGQNVLGNGRNGVAVDGVNSNANLIGGNNPGEGNTIGGNGLYGVWVEGSNNSVQGNAIGGSRAQGSRVPNRRGTGEAQSATGTRQGNLWQNQVVFNLDGGVQLNGQGAVVADDIEQNGGSGLLISGATGVQIAGVTITGNTGEDVDAVTGSATFGGNNAVGQVLQEGATLSFQGTNSLAGLNQTSGSTEVDGTITGTGSTQLTESGGSLAIYGTVNLDTTFTETNGTATLAGGTLAAPGGISIASGSILSGYGNIYGNVTDGGTLWAGSPLSAHNLTINGTLTVQSCGLLEFDLFASQSNGFLNVTGAATLGGTLQANLENGYNPAPGDQFALLYSPSECGQFSSYNLPSLTTGSWSVSYNTPYGLMLSVV